MRNRTTSEKILVIFEFSMAARFFNFSLSGADFRNKEQVEDVSVRVGIRIACA